MKPNSTKKEYNTSGENQAQNFFSPQKISQLDLDFNAEETPIIHQQSFLEDSQQKRPMRLRKNRNLSQKKGFFTDSNQKFIPYDQLEKQIRDQIEQQQKLLSQKVYSEIALTSGNNFAIQQMNPMIQQDQVLQPQQLFSLQQPQHQSGYQEKSENIIPFSNMQQQPSKSSEPQNFESLLSPISKNQPFINFDSQEGNNQSAAGSLLPSGKNLEDSIPPNNIENNLNYIKSESANDRPQILHSNESANSHSYLPPQKIYFQLKDVKYKNYLYQKPIQYRQQFHTIEQLRPQKTASKFNWKIRESLQSEVLENTIQNKEQKKLIYGEDPVINSRYSQLNSQNNGGGGFASSSNTSLISSVIQQRARDSYLYHSATSQTILPVVRQQLKESRTNYACDKHLNSDPFKNQDRITKNLKGLDQQVEAIKQESSDFRSKWLSPLQIKKEVYPDPEMLTRIQNTFLLKEQQLKSASASGHLDASKPSTISVLNLDKNFKGKGNKLRVRNQYLDSQNGVGPYGKAIDPFVNLQKGELVQILQRKSPGAVIIEEYNKLLQIDKIARSLTKRAIQVQKMDLNDASTKRSGDQSNNPAHNESLAQFSESNEEITPETFIVHNEFFGSSMRIEPEIRQRIIAGLANQFQMLDLNGVQLYYKLFVFLTANFVQKSFFIIKYLAYPIQYFNEEFYNTDIKISYLTHNLQLLLNQYQSAEEKSTNSDSNFRESLNKWRMALQSRSSERSQSDNETMISLLAVKNLIEERTIDPDLLIQLMYIN